MLIDEKARVCAHWHIHEKLFFIELESPQIARAILPGQFVHMQIPGMSEKILRRPFSVYKANPETSTIVILYQVVGRGTEVLSRVSEGEMISLIGPIGNTWTPPEDARPLLVCGGVGAAPLFMLAAQLSSVGPVTVIMGAQTKDALVTLDDYSALNHCEVIPATDDGSFGFAGFCTQPAQEAIETGNYNYVAVCGPEPLMKIVSSYTSAASIDCEVSLERRMACGVGACLSCVVDTTEGKKRCCIEGPIFHAAKVVW